MIYSFGRNGLQEMLGLGESAPEATSTPTPIKGLPSVGGDLGELEHRHRDTSRKARRRRRCCRSGAPPKRSKSTGRAPAEAYRLRWRPLGTKPWSKLLEREGGCAAEAGCAYQQTISGLGPQPYEVDLVDAKLSEGKTTHEKSRYITGTPAPGARSPAEHGGARDRRTPAAGPERDRLARDLDQQPRPRSATSGCAAKATAKPGGEEELGQECEAIEGATAAAYTPQAADARHALRVSVRASNAAGWSLAVSRPEVVLGARRRSARAGAGKRLGSHHHRSGRAGQDADRAPRRLGRGSRRLLLQVAALQRAAPARAPAPPVRAIPGAAGQTLHARKRRRRHVDRGPGDGRQQRRLQRLELRSRRSDPARSARGHAPAGHHRHDPAGPDADRARRQLDQQRQSAGLAVAALRRRPAAAARRSRAPPRRPTSSKPEDVGHALVVSETVENAVGRSAPATSLPTLAVPVPPPAPESTSLPAITGSAQQGQTLTEHAGGWTGEPTGYSYAWKRCSPTGTECKADLRRRPSRPTS